MASQGVICTRLVSPLELPVKEFYNMMERDVSADVAIALCHDVAKTVKKMLGAVRRKWKKWEMPRVP